MPNKVHFKNEYCKKQHCRLSTQKTNYNNKKVTSTAPLQGLCFFIYNPLKTKTMKITINTDVLHKENLSLGDFLTLLIGYYDIDYKDCFYRMIETELAAPNVFHEDSLILSDNT